MKNKCIYKIQHEIGVSHNSEIKEHHYKEVTAIDIGKETERSREQQIITHREAIDVRFVGYKRDNMKNQT